MTDRGGADRQLPFAGEIFLDHLGHFVPDREAAARALARAGFAATPVSIQVHPDPGGGSPQLTGTGNVTAMFPRGYIEVLFKTTDTPLARELDAALARYHGVHLTAFAVADAADAHRRLAAQTFRMRPLVHMQRPVDTGGAAAFAAFTLARVEPGEMPEGRIQILTHHTEDLVWQPRWLTHANGALALTTAMIAVADVEEAAARFARFTARTPLPATCGRTIALDRGRIELMTAAGFAQRLPEIPIPSLPFIGAYGIRVRSLAALEQVLRDGGIQAHESARGLAASFPQELGQGAWVFEE